MSQEMSDEIESEADAYEIANWRPNNCR